MMAHLPQAVAVAAAAVALVGDVPVLAQKLLVLVQRPVMV